MTSADEILSNGLSLAASLANKSGTKSAGSFFAVGRSQATFDEAWDIASDYAVRASTFHGGTHCIIVCRLPVSVVSELESSGLLVRGLRMTESIFLPGSFGKVNSAAEWLGPYG